MKASYTDLSIKTFYFFLMNIVIIGQAYCYSVCADGDLGFKGTSIDCYMKQKHRMIWERRHGPVGSGKKTMLGPPKH